MKARKINTWELERYILGELPPDRLAEIGEAIDRDPALKHEVESLRASDRDILARYGADSVVPGIMAGLRESARDVSQENRRRARLRTRVLFAAPAFAALAVLLLVVLGRDGEAPWGTRIKGDEDIDYNQTQILLFRKRIDEAEILASGETASPGDLLQIAYVPAGRPHGMILSLDGNGVVTLHYPENEGASTDLVDERSHVLASAYELDDAPGFERFFFVTGDVAIDVPAVLESARLLARSPAAAETDALDLPPDLRQFSFILYKGRNQ